MSDNTILKQHFEGFAAAVIPDDAPEGQIRDMESAFMGGAMVLFHTLTADMEEEQTIHIMTSIDIELKAFAESKTVDFK